MNTTNLISTPNITGNIGSCRSESVTVNTTQGVVWMTKETIVTNSCTGSTTSYGTWTLGPAIGVPVFIISAFLILGVVGFSSRYFINKMS